VEPIDELEAERDHQREPQKHIRQDGFVMHERQIVKQAGAGVANSDDEYNAENQHSDFAGRTVELLVKYAGRCRHGQSSGRCGIEKRLRVLKFGATIRKDCYGSVNKRRAVLGSQFSG
jgi:hypothetical protein